VRWTPVHYFGGESGAGNISGWEPRYHGIAMSKARSSGGGGGGGGDYG